MTDNSFRVTGTEPIPGTFVVFQKTDPSKTVLTIYPDGRLEFGPNAHPEEVVEMLFNAWRQYVPPCECRKTREAE